MKRLAVIFPGFNYSVDAPLLYYADFLFDSLGYERIHMDYGCRLQDRSIDFSVRLDQLRQHELQQLSTVLWDEYDSIVFLSKSIGTVEAGWIADALSLSVKQIFLTPVAESLPYCDQHTVILLGTQDPCYTLYREFCLTHANPSLFIPGANHSLEINNDPFQSMEALQKALLFLQQTI